MASLGRVAANLLSATNENTLALGSLKLDFSIIKYEAPVEFAGLGTALSALRRTEAEDGTHHKTARRLAALFEQLIPSTPSLITAYGLRSSEIIQTPGVNPKGSPNHGPFKSFVGADGTAMWAAATSGTPALGVYLLACLLARAWDAKEAISIWVELVEQRRKAIEEDFLSNHAVSESSINSVRQDIRRDDLARWDASARAWLLSADQVKIKEHTQLMLILKNFPLPFHGGESTYSKVIQSWQQALTGLENLLSGKPQELSNCSIPLAFSAWHLYPNLIVLGSEVKKIAFHDPLVDQRGVGTMAVSPRSGTENRGPTWSLALSHLRYYGDPVTVQSHPDFSRVTINQLHIIALGSVIHTWGVSQRDTLPVLQWFVELGEFLGLTSPRSNSYCLDWLRYLVNAAETVLLSHTSANSAEHQLLAYGKRRAKNFLGYSKNQWPPFFGLAKESILAGLAETVDEERAIAYLRVFASDNSYYSSDAYISTGWKHCRVHDSYIHYCEYMTAVPHTCTSRKRDADGNQLTEIVHARWVYGGPKRHLQNTEDSTLFVEMALKERLKHYSARGERGNRIYDVPHRKGETTDQNWIWENPPLLLNYQTQVRLGYTLNPNTEPYSCPSISLPDVPCRCFDCNDHITEQYQEPLIFSPQWRIGDFTLLVNDKSMYPGARKLDDSIELRGESYLHPTVSAQKICKSAMKPDAVYRYLRHMMKSATKSLPDPHCTFPRKNYKAEQELSDDADGEPEGQYEHRDNFALHDEMNRTHAKSTKTGYIEKLADKWPMSETHVNGLNALTFATKVYVQLEGATISLKILETSLNEVPWFIEHCSSQVSPHNLRPNTLACIVHFESGTVLVNPDELQEALAIASGNSIFVIDAMLSDPFKTLATTSIKRIIGNIGRTGVCILVAPCEPRIRPLGDQYNLVEHAPYDGKREDNFKGTSLHLSFTDWNIPLEVKGAEGRTIDQEVYIVESVISVLDAGKWVADLDILRIEFETLTRLRQSRQCPGHSKECAADYDYTSLDSWEEFLDGPANVGFFRAHGNWAARLAAVSILSQKNQGHSVGVLGPEGFCLECLGSDHDVFGGLKKYESPLPSICID